MLGSPLHLVELALDHLGPGLGLDCGIRSLAGRYKHLVDACAVCEHANGADRNGEGRCRLRVAVDEVDETSTGLGCGVGDVLATTLALGPDRALAKILLCEVVIEGRLVLLILRPVP